MVKTQLVIIQPTTFCNINCDYCYLSQRAHQRRISLGTVEKIGKTLFASPFLQDTVNIVWHAGEPLTMPISFYEQAFHCLQQQNVHNLRIVHAIQTNATLITQKWCDFIKRQQMQIGVSLDGPEHIHDAHRRDRQQRGTFKRVMRGVELLQRNAIPFAVIAVITRHTLSHTEDFWHFFADIQPTRLCLNPEEQEGANSSSSLAGEDGFQHYKRFFKELLSLNERASRPLKIREFETVSEHVKGGGPLTRSQTSVPGVIWSFDCNGGISTFSPEMLTMKHTTHGDFLFGNVSDTALEEIFTTKKFLAVNEEIQRGVVQCLQTCEHFSFCGGGFPSNKLSEHGSFEASETQACRLHIKATADVGLRHWEEKYQLSLFSYRKPQEGDA
jgi:uncharacterized protein